MNFLDIHLWYNPRRKRFWLLVIALAYTLAGFLLAPWALQRELPNLSRQFLQRDALAAQIKFNPWILRLTVEDLVLLDTDTAPIFSLKKLVADVEVRSLLNMAIVLREVTLVEPEIVVTRYQFADTNIRRMLTDMERADELSKDQTVGEPLAADADSILRVVIDELNIVTGVIDLNDEMQGTPFNTRLEPINISVTDFSTLPNKAGLQSIAVTTETGASVNWTGSLQINPLVSSGTIELAGSPLPLLHRYFSETLGFNFADCCMDVSMDYEVTSQADGNVAVAINNLSLSSGNVEIDTLDGSTSIFKLSELRISGGTLRWPEQRVRIAEILISEPALNSWLDTNGELNLTSLLPASPAEPAPAVETDDVEDGSPPWDISLGELRIAGAKFDFEDRSLPKPGRVQITSADFRISEVSNQLNSSSPFTLAVQLADSGSMNFNGSAVLLPEPIINSELEIIQLPLQLAQPWLEPFARIVINDGALNIAGTVSSSPAEQLDFTADIAIDNLQVDDTLHKQSLIAWRKLQLERTNLQLTQRQLEISQIRLDKPDVRLVIAQDGTTNFQELAVDSGTAEPEAAGGQPNADGEPAFTIKVGKTTLNDGFVDFSDFSLPLPFRAPISEFEGSLAAFASNSRQSSALDMQGKVGDYGLVTVDGSLRVPDPLAQSAMNVAFRNISMPTLSPYTAQFAGRKISSGSLDLDLSYQFEQSRMIGDNSLLLKDFKLGDKLDSPEAMNLPLDLAIALLTDVNGNIDLDLRVEGDLDDPEFSAGGIILKTLANVITKAAAAPFSLLGGLLPGGAAEQLDTINFEAGSADLMPPEREKIAQLATALGMRPALVLDIPAGFNVAADTAALQAQAVESQLADLVSAADGEQMLTAKTSKALEKLARAQLPELSLRDLKNEFVTVAADSGSKGLDDLAYIEELRARLEAIQNVEMIQLIALGEARRAAIINELTVGGTLAASQMQMTDPSEFPLDDNGWISIELALDVSNSKVANTAP